MSAIRRVSPLNVEDPAWAVNKWRYIRYYHYILYRLPDGVDGHHNLVKSQVHHLFGSRHKSQPVCVADSGTHFRVGLSEGVADLIPDFAKIDLVFRVYGVIYVFDFPLMPILGGISQHAFQSTGNKSKASAAVVY